MEIRQVSSCIRKHYGIDPEHVIRLGGYDNFNYKISSADTKYVFKVYEYNDEKKELLLKQNEVLSSLSAHKKNAYPSVIPSKNNSFLMASEDGQWLFRLLSYLEGEFIGSLPGSDKLFSSLGSFLAELDLYLMTQVSHSYSSYPNPWDLEYFLLNESLLPFIEDQEKRSWLEFIFSQYRAHVLPVIPQLRRSLIHGDANEWNTLARQNEVSAIIDFDDMNFGPLIHDLAICSCYALLGRKEPVKWACKMIKSYHEVLALEKQEIGLLYYLIAARLCTSVCHSAKGRHDNPDNVHQFVSELNAWSLLEYWVQLKASDIFSQFMNAIESNRDLV